MRTPLFDLSARVAYHGVMRRLLPSRYQPPQPRWVTVAAGPLKGGELYLATEATDTWRLMASGIADEFLFSALVEAGPLQGTSIWDIGAHFGYHSLCFAALVGQGGRVISFEPNPANLERFRMHLGRNPALAERVQLESAAVADKAGEATFILSDVIESGGSSGSHLAGVGTTFSADHYQLFRPHPVKLVCVDDLVLKEGYPAPVVMKIDVEGAEGMVLDGAMETLRKHHPFLLMEIHHILQMKKVGDVLRDLGYTVRVLEPERATASRCFIAARRA